MPISTASQFRDEFMATFAADANATSQALVATVLDYPVAYRAEQTADVYTNTLGVVAALCNTVHTLDTGTTVRLRVTKFNISPGVTVTSDNTNYANIVLAYNNANGGSDTVIAFQNTTNAAAGGSGSITAGTPKSVSIISGGAVVPLGSLIKVTVTKAAGGVALPSTCFEVKGQLL